MKQLILALYVLHFIFLAYLNNVYLAGLPLRSFLILLTGALVIAVNVETFYRLRLVNTIYGILALLGLLVSLAGGVGIGDIVSGELKLFQSYLMILVSYYLFETFTFRNMAILLLALMLPSAIVGFMQGLDFQPAWQIHERLTQLQNKEISDEIQAQLDAVLTVRPPGLALYAIPQTYMLLAGMLLNAYLILMHKDDDWVQVAAFITGALLLLGIIASETRSAMGAGILLLLVVYIRAFPAKTLLILLLAGVGGAMFWLGGDNGNLDSRLLSLDDQSAVGRMTLLKYGTELFLQHPFGYGFGFDTVEYAVDYFINERNLFDYEVYEKAQYIVPVHNSILNLVHIYGFAGLLLLGYYLYRLGDGLWYRWAFLGVTLLNSVFHNAGILSGDLYIDIVIAAFLLETWLREQSREGQMA